MCTFERDQKAAKFWLDPVRLAYNQGFAAQELKKVTTPAQQHQSELVKAWHEYFKPGN